MLPEQVGLLDVHCIPVNLEVGLQLKKLLLAVEAPAKATTSPCKRERRSLFEECQDRLTDMSGASDHAGEAPRLEYR